MSLWPSRRGGPAGGEHLLWGGAPVLWSCERPPLWGASDPPAPWPGMAPPGGQAARGLRGLTPSGRVPFPPSVPPAPPAAPRAPAATARIRLCGLASARRDGAHAASRVPRCPARPCATSSWATSGWPTSPSSAPAAAARIWLLLADKPHAASAAWLHQVGCPSRPACLPRLPLPRERPSRRHASGPRASRDGPRPAPASLAAPHGPVLRHHGQPVGGRLLPVPRPPLRLASGSSWRTSRTRPPRPGSIRSGALPAQRVSRASRCPASARRDGTHPLPRASRCPASASLDGAHPPPPGDSASTPPGATPASLPPLPGAPRRGAARRRSSPRLGRSSAPRWWGSP